jgi:hypothetical protein
MASSTIQATLITPKYNSLCTLALTDPEWFCHPKEVLFMKAIKYKLQ